jgi:hypothetical protein
MVSIVQFAVALCAFAAVAAIAEAGYVAHAPADYYVRFLTKNLNTFKNFKVKYMGEKFSSQ